MDGGPSEPGNVKFVSVLILNKNKNEHLLFI